MSRILKAFLENEGAIKRLLGRFFSRAQDVDDLAQEAFLRAFAAESDREIREPKAFLFRTARNLALNERARLAGKLTRSMEDSADSDVLVSAGQVSAEDQIDARQRLALFAEAVAALPPQCRRVFVLRKVHGLSQKDIAERLDISQSTVEKHVAMGLVKCSDYLRRAGAELTPPASPRAGAVGRRERAGDE
ncbi:MAG: RNA polymerase sigma factor [Alphaproteobacteria bacterium]|nr:RNA polymerase sigma factor [Alphaproteobacteria bacterium]